MCVYAVMFSFILFVWWFFKKVRFCGNCAEKIMRFCGDISRKFNNMQLSGENREVKILWLWVCKSKEKWLYIRRKVKNVIYGEK